MRHGDDGENENQAPLGQTRPGCSVLGPASCHSLSLPCAEETIRSSYLLLDLWLAH